MTDATGPATLAPARRSPAGAAGSERLSARTILVVDPGSTTTKVALVTVSITPQPDAPPSVDPASALVIEESQPDVVVLARATLRHFTGEADFSGRLRAVTDWLATLPERNLDAVAGRGGLLRPVPAGTYAVSDAMVADLRAGVRGEHAANFGGLIARTLADAHGVPAFVVDPVSTDEFAPVARVAGIAQLERRSLLHALNVRAVARRDCAARGVRLDDANLVVAHLGGGISVVAIERGRLVDANNADEEGPFSPARTGGLPSGQLADLVFSGRLPDWDAARAFLHREGGLRAYLGTDNLAVVERRIAAGDARAAAVLDAMAYQIATCVGAYATVLAGRVDAVLLTGGGARSTVLTEAVIDRVAWIAPVRVHPGEDELVALAEGAARVLNGTEPARDYASSAAGASAEHSIDPSADPSTYPSTDPSTETNPEPR